MPWSVPIGGLGLTLISCFLTGIAIGNAYYQKKQFYPSVVYLTKSNPSMAAIYLMAFTLVILFGKLMKRIFFGTLRPAESEHLIERFFYAVTETCLAFTMFRDDFSPKFMMLFTVLLFLKSFHWLIDNRVDYMERSPVISRLFHIRVASLLVLLSSIDFILVRHAYNSIMSMGASVQLVFGFEYAILLTVVYSTGIKYVLHAIDLNSDNPWENKSLYLLYTELLVGFITVVLYMIFLVIMIRIHTFPLFIIRPMYLSMKVFKRALQDMLQSRRAIHNMNTLYPDATTEDLRNTDNVCIICREEMLVNAGVKKLPCNHLFHALCLRSWFQRQQTCPTCRHDVLRPTVQLQQQAPPAAAAAQPRPQPANFRDFLQQMIDPNEAARRQNNGNNQQQRPPAPPILLHPQLLQQIEQQIRQQQAGTTASTQSNAATAQSSVAASSSTTTATTTTSSATSTSASTAPGVFISPLGSLPLPPLSMFMPPFMGLPPFPTPPPDYSGLTMEELRALEGKEREHIVRRLQLLQNINTLVNAALVQLTQYDSVVTRLYGELPSSTAPTTTDTATANSSTTVTAPSAASSTTVSSSSSSSSTPAASSSIFPGGLSVRLTLPLQLSVSNSEMSKAKAVNSILLYSDARTSSTVDSAGTGESATASSNSTAAASSTAEGDISTVDSGDRRNSDVTDAEEVRRRRLQRFAADAQL